MNKKFSFILEIIWLVLTILSALAGIQQTIDEGFEKSYMFFILSAVAGLIYTLRRFIRKAGEKTKKQ